MKRSARSLHVDSLEALLKGRMAKLIIDRDFELLREVARLAQADAPVDLAMTDPARYRAIREAVTRYHLKGWTDVTPENIDRLAAHFRAKASPGNTAGYSRNSKKKTEAAA